MSSRHIEHSSGYAAANLFMYVDRVERPLVVLQADRWGCHRLVVLRTDDDDDQVLFLRKNRHVVRVLQERELIKNNQLF